MMEGDRDVVRGGGGAGWGGQPKIAISHVCCVRGEL